MKITVIFPLLMENTTVCLQTEKFIEVTTLYFSKHAEIKLNKIICQSVWIYYGIIGIRHFLIYRNLFPY
jgi:hypothetical protein